MLLLTASPALAETYDYPKEEVENVKSMTPYLVALHLSAAADIYSTHRCVNIRETCNEANPIYGKKPSLSKLILIRGGSSLVSHLILVEISKKNPRTAKTTAISLSLVGFGVAALNMRF